MKKATKKKARKANKKPTHILVVKHNAKATEGRAHLVHGIRGAQKVIREHHGFHTDLFELFEIKSRAKLKVVVVFT